MLQKGTYPYKCTDNWEKFNEIWLPEKEDFYNHLNMENITDIDYMHAKKILWRFWYKKLKRLSWFVCSKRYIIVSWLIYKLDCVPGFAWQTAFKKTKVKLDLLTDMDMLLVVEKGFRGRMCHSIYWYGKANNKYMIYYDRNKELSYIQYWDVNKSYDGQCYKSFK